VPYQLITVSFTGSSAAGGSPPATFAGLDRQVVLLAKTADRSVLGCTNDMAFLYHHDP
jgi:hypothetical protein